MLRRCLRFAAAGLLFVSLATCGLWMRSYWRGDRFTYSSGRLTILIDSADAHLFGDLYVAPVGWDAGSGFRVQTTHFPADRERFWPWPTRYGFAFTHETDNTGRHVEVLAPHAAIAAIFATFSFVLFRFRRKRPGYCRQCGYDLRATPERCPECGMAVRPTLRLL